MNVPSIFVVGPEGSGTTLLSQCLALHPELAGRRLVMAPTPTGPLPASDAIVHLSLPTLRPMRWVEAKELPPEARVVVVRRSPLHTVYSAYRRFYDRPEPAWRAYVRAVALEADYVARHDALCVFYEDLVHHPAKALRFLYAHLGVDPGFVPSIRLDNRNDERWREDPAFAEYVSRAFDVPAEVASPPTAEPPPVLLAFRSYGASIGIADASGAGIAAAMRDWLPPNLEEPGEEEPDARYRVERVAGHPGAPQAFYRVLNSGEVGCRARSAERVREWLCREVDRVVSETSRAALFVHAGVVGWRGRAIVIPGRTMTGKSTLVAELVRHGATYYSDEFAVLDDAGRVLPYARKPLLRDGGTAPDLRRDATEPLPVAVIVSTAFHADATWRPEEVRGLRAAIPIIDNTVPAREQTPRLLRLTAKIASHAVNLRGPRPDATEMAPRLLAYVDALAAGEQEAVSEGHRGEVQVARAQAVLAGVAAPDEIRPPRFVRLDALLDDDTHARLLAAACAREGDFVASQVLLRDGTARFDERVRRSGTLSGVGDVHDALVERLRRVLPHVRRELRFPWFPLGKIECQMAVHREGGFFGRHVDNGYGTVSGRRLTCVYYLHALPKGFSGGALRLYEGIVRGGRVTAGSSHVQVEPLDNTAVFFSSDTFHEVCPVVQQSPEFGASRFSVTVWFWAGTQPTCLEPLGKQNSACDR